MSTGRSEDPAGSALFTDLYELTMARAYAAEGMDGEATFELFFREMPPARGYVVAAGLADVVDWLEGFGFTGEDLEYLRRDGRFDEAWLGSLRSMCFTGDVWAVPEGTVVFAGEPLVQVVAPIAEAQLAETWILNQVHYQSIVATKAARCVQAAQGRTVVDFGSRRAHAADAALKAARATWLAGGAGTSNVLAGKRYGVPTFGTMAHSYVQAHDREEDAFAAFAGLFPGATILVDTYDTLDGVRKVIRLVREREPAPEIGAVRLDSGDLVALARAARRLLDEAGLQRVKVFASSRLDEHRIARLLAADAPIDGFGVGTDLVVSPDAPALDMAYKLVSYDGVPRTKLSSHKVIHPGRKQVFRREEGGVLAGDVLARHDERLDGEPLLRRVMRAGRRTAEVDLGLDAARRRCAAGLGRLPEPLRALAGAVPPYPVQRSGPLEADLERLRAKLGAQG